MLSSVIVTDAMIQGKSFQNQMHVYFSVQSYLSMQIKLGTSPYKKLGRGSKSSAGGFLDFRAEI